MAELIKDPISGTYQVKQGDTLSKIASTQGRTLAELIATNPQYAKNPNLIRPGDIIQGGTASGPSYSNLTNTNVNAGNVSNPNPTVNFTTALIQMLKDAQQRDTTGQASLMKQSQGITGMGLNDANMNFRNKYLSPSAGTSLGLSAQNEFDPLQLSIANQQKLASQNLGNITDLIKQTSSDYQEEQDRLARAEENRLDRAASAAKAAADRSSSSTIKLTPTDKQGLLGAGFLPAEIAQIEKDINTYGINKTLEGITDPAQKAAIQKVYSGTAPKDTTQFLDKEYLRALYTNDSLEKAAADAGFGDLGEGFWNLKDVDTEGYLDHLQSLITQYRKAGYTDKEILNLMK